MIQSIHAVDRYIQRFEPQLSWGEAKRQIACMIADSRLCVASGERVNYWGEDYIVITDGKKVITIERRVRA